MKVFVMTNRRQLKGIENPLNEKDININEPPDPVEQSIFSESEKRALL